MALDEAIKHAEEAAEEQEKVAEWLRDYKRLLEQTRWIPINEGLPKENKTVIASTLYGVYPEARYTKENGWEWAYESGADYWKELEGVEAWMRLPKPYKQEK